MIQTLRDLIASLSQDLSVAEISAHLGPITSDPGPPLLAELTPKDPSFSRVAIGRYRDDGKPYTVDLELSAPLAVASLSAAFGSYKQVRTDRGQPRKIAFSPAGTGPWKIVLLVQVPSGMSPIDEAETRRLVLRRDPP
jgi:hypothetical protein